MSCLLYFTSQKNKFYIGCDACDGWFHGSCVSVTEEESRDIEQYICPPCQEKTGRHTLYTSRAAGVCVSAREIDR